MPVVQMYINSFNDLYPLCLDYKSNHFSTKSVPDSKKRMATPFFSEFCLIFVKRKIKQYGY